MNQFILMGNTIVLSEFCRIIKCAILRQGWPRWRGKEVKMDHVDLPLGFSMMLAQNLKAMNQFAKLTREQRQTVVEGARHIDSHDEMRKYVNEFYEKLS